MSRNADDGADCTHRLCAKSVDPEYVTGISGRKSGNKSAPSVVIERSLKTHRLHTIAGYKFELGFFDWLQCQSHETLILFSSRSQMTLPRHVWQSAPANFHTIHRLRQ